MTELAQATSPVAQTLWAEPQAPERTDQQLLQSFHSGTIESAEAAFTILVERHGPIVHRVCLDILGNLHDAQDAAQAVFLVLARKARLIRKPESLGPWLHGVALRVARQARRQAARRAAAEHRKAESSSRPDHTEYRPEPMDHDDLHQEIDRLPEKYRLPIILCYMQGRTQPQTAQLLGWPLGTVQIRLHRGRERLRSRLTRTGSGLLALTASDFTRMASATGIVLDRAWIETTARAGVRFAAGKATAGLVAPPVSGLATLVLRTMLVDSLKTVALIVITLLFIAAGLTLSWLPASGLSPKIPPPDPKTATAVPALVPKPTSVAADPPAPSEIGDGTDRPSPSDRPAGPETKTAGRTAKPDTTPPALAPPPSDPFVNDTTRPRPQTSSDRSRSLAPLDRQSDRSARLGRELFERAWTREDPRSHGGDGLGPVFNAQSCVACHNLGGAGGAGSIDRNIEIVTATATAGSLAEYTGYSYSFSMDFGAGKFEYRMGADPQAQARREPQPDPRLAAAIHAGFHQSRSVVLHRFSTDPTYNSWRESVAGRHGPILVGSSQRNPPPLFGAGRIDAIPDEAIEAAAKRRASGSAQVKGRVSRLKDGRIGRFGWKAQTATLEEFVLSAAAGEMGLEVPGAHQAADPRLPGVAAKGLDMDQDECNLLIEYVRTSSRASRGKTAWRKDRLANQGRRSNLQVHRLRKLPLAEIGTRRRNL